MLLVQFGEKGQRAFVRQRVVVEILPCQGRGEESMLLLQEQPICVAK